MKKQILSAIIFTMIICFSNSYGTTEGIKSVNIIPGQPFVTDLIKFDISGSVSARPSRIAYDEYSKNGTQLRLDLYLDPGVMPAFSDWSYEKQIGTLDVGTYSLEVRLYNNYYDTLIDTHAPVYFTVVPEPGTLSLFGGGALLFRILQKGREQFD